MKNRRVPSTGPGESSREGDSGWLTVLLRQMWGHPKGYPYGCGCTIYRVPVMTFAVMSYCTRYLSEVWPDTFYFISRVMPVGENVKRHAPGL